ncbi:MAG: bifunctional (p)ppGpp synthetase/guanosine-3',5'-bis(diphosphate) 3'-pyrophosphohydrolase [Alphaproteobacteria bacterium]|nr:bifunctional (p)ppGpp synthetase/guanosine-3',5'-bis(diphosphate) 3'-pyrophosphohydrolase [Alphaproteobacteria bacterium]
MACHADWESKFKSCDYSDKLLEKINRLNAETNDAVDIQRVKKAIYFAKEFHSGQSRQSGEPYYTHPLEVASMVCNYLLDTVSIITSILHDTLEDTDLDYATIAEHFGDLVAAQVEDLTRIKPFGKITSADILKQLWKEKKYNLLLIKLVDRLHNMQTIFAKSPEKQHKIVTETLQYFLVVGEALGLPSLVDSLYEICHQTNIRLGLIIQDELILDESVELAGSLISESN